MNLSETEAVVERLLASDDVDAVLAQLQERHDVELMRVGGNLAAVASTTTRSLTKASVTRSGSRSGGHDLENPLTVFTNGALLMGAADTLRPAAVMPDKHRNAESGGKGIVDVTTYSHHDASRVTTGRAASSSVMSDRRSLSLMSPAMDDHHDAGDSEPPPRAPHVQSTSAPTRRRLLAPPLGEDADDTTQQQIVPYHARLRAASSGTPPLAPPLHSEASAAVPPRYHPSPVIHELYTSRPPSTLPSDGEDGEVHAMWHSSNDAARSVEHEGGATGAPLQAIPLHHINYNDLVKGRPTIGGTPPQKGKRPTASGKGLLPPSGKTPSPSGKRHVALSPNSKLNVSTRAQMSRQTLRRNYAELVAARPPPPPDPSFLAYHDGHLLREKFSASFEGGDTSAMVPATVDARGSVSPPRRLQATGARYIPDPFLLHAPFGYQAPAEDDLDGFDGSAGSPGGLRGALHHHHTEHTKRSRRGSATAAPSGSADGNGSAPAAGDAQLQLLKSPKGGVVPTAASGGGFHVVVDEADDTSSAVGGIYDPGTYQQRSFEVEGEPLTDDDADHGQRGNIVPVLGSGRQLTRKVIEHQQHVRPKGAKGEQVDARSKFRNSLLVVQSPMQRHQLNHANTNNSSTLAAPSALSSPPSQPLLSVGGAGGGGTQHQRSDTLDSMALHPVDYYEHSDSHAVSVMDDPSITKPQPLGSKSSSSSIRASGLPANNGKGNNSSSKASSPRARAPPAAVAAGGGGAAFLSAASPLGADNDFAVAPRSASRHDNDSDSGSSDYTYDYSYTYSSYYTASDRSGDDSSTECSSGAASTISNSGGNNNRNQRTGATQRGPAPRNSAGAPKPSNHGGATTNTGTKAPAPATTTNNSFQGPPPTEWMMKAKSSLGSREAQTLLRFGAALQRVGRPVSSVASASSAQDGIVPRRAQQQVPPQPRQTTFDGLQRVPSMRTSTRFQMQRNQLRTPLLRTAAATSASRLGSPALLGPPPNGSFANYRPTLTNNSMSRRPPMTPTSGTYRGPTSELLPFASVTSGAIQPHYLAQQQQQQQPPRTPRFVATNSNNRSVPSTPSLQQLALTQPVSFPQPLSSGNTSRSVSGIQAHPSADPAYTHTAAAQVPPTPRAIIWESKGHTEVLASKSTVGPSGGHSNTAINISGISATDRFHVPSQSATAVPSPAVISTTADGGTRFAAPAGQSTPTAEANVVYRSGSRGTTATTVLQERYTEDVRRGDVVAQRLPQPSVKQSVAEGASPNGGMLRPQQQQLSTDRSASTLAAATASISIPHSRSASAKPTAGATAHVLQQPVPVARVTAEYQGRSASFHDPNATSSIQSRFGIQVR